jgi:Domain of unknown function (DUF4333)
VPRRRLLLAVPALMVALSSCGGQALTAGVVETGAEDALEREVGVRPDVSCPDDLPAEVGAELRCTLTADGDDARYGVTVTVSSVEGETANFDVEVDPEPME